MSDGFLTNQGQTIGDAEIFDWRQTILSQYANSSALIAIIESLNDAIDPTANLEDFFDLVWNVDTAQGYGLDVWGRIVGVSRVLQIAVGAYLGFQGPTGASGDSFNVAVFYAGAPATSNYALTDQAFRTLIIAKALANISDGSIASINNILMTLFGSQGVCYVTDGGNMTLTYTFLFALDPVSAAIVGQSGVLPKPAGVLASVSHL